MAEQLTAVTPPAGPPLVRLVTIPEAARRIGFPASRVFQQVQHGNVTAYRVAGKVIVLRAEDVELVRELVVTSLRQGPTRGPRGGIDESWVAAAS
jgi:hypothetical protein